MKKKLKVPIIWIGLLMIGFGSFFFVESISSTETSMVDTSEFVQMLKRGELKNVRIAQNEFIAQKVKGDGNIKTVADKTAPYVTDVIVANVETFNEEPPPRSYGPWISLITTILVLAVIVFIFIFIGKKISQRIGMSGDSLTKHQGIRVESATGVTFQDVAGIDEAKNELQEALEFLRHPDKYKNIGAKLPKGILLTGPPGCGKTLLAKALAGEAGVPFFYVSGSSFVQMYVGLGAARVRSLFEEIKQFTRCVVFIDEIDSLARKRGGMASTGGKDEAESTLTEFLQSMDGFDTANGVLFVAATNRPEILDDAILRAGRFSRKVVISAPDVFGREKILDIHIKNNNVKVTRDLNRNAIALSVPGFTGADIANLVNEAAIEAIRSSKTEVDYQCFLDARDRILMGTERRDASTLEWDKVITAVHEVGHVVTAWFDPYCDSVNKVTIIPRGQSRGSTWSFPEHDRLNYSKEELLAQIRNLLGGRVAEEVFIGSITTGASNDLERANAIAENMVTKLGMGKPGDLRTYRDSDSLQFIGSSSVGSGSISTSVVVDEMVRNILNEQYESIKKEFMDSQQVNIFKNVVNELLQFETLVTEDLVRLLGPKVRNPERTVKDMFK